MLFVSIELLEVVREWVVEKCGQGWKMCQIFKFKQCNKLKMSYIQQFLQQQLFQFFSSTLRAKARSASFSDFTAEDNIFSLAVDLLLFVQRGSWGRLKDSLHGFLQKELIIPYECLRNYRLAVGQSDGEAIRLMKTELKQVHTLMLQLLLRVVLSYIESTCSQCLNNTILTHISEISYIYPQVKTQISIDHPDINLPAFLQKYFMEIAKNGMNSVFTEILTKIKEQCGIMGNLERVIDRIIESYKGQTQTQSKKIDISSIDSQNDDENQKENNSVYNDIEFLRRKKKRVFKQITRAKSDAENRTPVKEMIIIARSTPKTEKTEANNKPLESKSPHKRTPIFKKIKKPLKKPLERTIYYGQTKKFVPKKSINPEFYLQKMLTSSSLLKEPSISYSYAENGRKTQKKSSKIEMEEIQVNGFCIPQTPRPNAEKKSSLVKKTQSMDLFKIGVQGLKN